MFAAAGGSLIFFNEITGRPASYASEVVYQLHQGKQSVVHFDPVIYLGWYVVRNGVAATALLAIGLVWCLVRPTFTRVATMSLVLVPYGLYVFAPFIVPRNLVAALPFAALTAAVGLVQSARRWPPLHQPLVAIVPLALALAVIGASMSWRLTEERSGFASAALAVNRNGGRALTSSEVMVFYLRGSGGTCNAPAIPVRLRVLAADVRAGYRLAVLENHHNSAVTHYIKTHGRLVATWPAFGGPDIGESPIASENGNAPQAPGTPEVVSLYDLSSLRLPPPGHTHSQTCRLDLPT
jgi:hypothetical protein